MYSEEWKNEVHPDEFWDYIELARSARESFTKKMAALDRRSLIRFAWYYEMLASRLGQEPYRLHTDPTFSSDYLDDLWEEVVGMGFDYYNGVIHHPEKMPGKVTYSDPSHYILHGVSNIFYKRYNEEIPPNSYDY